MDLSTGHAVLKSTEAMDDFTKGMIAAVNGMLLDMLAVVARKDYEDRRRRQAEGIKKAKADGVYRANPSMPSCTIGSERCLLKISPSARLPSSWIAARQQFRR